MVLPDRPLREHAVAANRVRFGAVQRRLGRLRRALRRGSGRRRPPSGGRRRGRPLGRNRPPLSRCQRAPRLVKPQLGAGQRGISPREADQWGPPVRFDLHRSADLLTSA